MNRRSWRQYEFDAMESLVELEAAHDHGDPARMLRELIRFGEESLPKPSRLARWWRRAAPFALGAVYGYLSWMQVWWLSAMAVGAVFGWLMVRRGADFARYDMHADQIALSIAEAKAHLARLEGDDHE